MAEPNEASPSTKPKFNSTERGSFFQRPSTAVSWVLHDYKNWPLSWSCNNLRSPTFQIEDKSDINWAIELSADRSGYLSADLLMDASDDDILAMAVLKLSVIVEEFRERMEQRAHHVFSRDSKTYRFKSLIPNCTSLGKENSQLFDGNLFLFCEIIVVIDDRVLEDKSNDNQTRIIARSLASLLKNGYFSDFTIQVKDQQLKCHKCVLSCRSEVFSAMMKHKMKERSENRLILTDIEPGTLQKLLYYIYTGDVNVSEPNEILQLYLAADKYGFERLKLLCEKKMCCYLSLVNAVELVTLASIYGLRKLATKSSCIALAFNSHVNVSNPEAKTDLLPLHSKPESSGSSTSGSTTEPNQSSSRARDQIDESVSVDVDNSDANISEAKFSPLAAQVWIRTEPRVSVTTEWTVGVDIENYERVHKTDTLHLFHDSYNEAVWQISVRLKIHKKNSSVIYLSLYLKLLSSKQDSIFTEYKLSALNVAGTNPRWGSVSCDVGKLQIMAEDYLWVDRTKLLTFSCSLMIRKSFLHDSRFPIIPECDLVRSVSTLLEDETFADVTIAVEEESFRSHKALLASESPLFRSMFQQDPPASVIRLQDMDSNLFRKVLRCVYTGECDPTYVEAKVLLPLSNKYHLLGLISICENSLITFIAIENVAEILVLADVEKAAKLREEALRFIHDHLPSVMATPAWREIPKRKNLLFECLRFSKTH